MNKGNLRSRGFTLIELLVVIAIIGILSAVVLGNLNSARTKARDSKRLADINAVVKAIELYYDDNNIYPDVLADLVPAQIAATPVDPSSASGATVNYLYAAFTTGTAGSGACNAGYHIGAALENDNNTALQSDDDSAVSSATCLNSADDFDAAEPVYAVKR